MDNASARWLKRLMRSGFVGVCGLVFLVAGLNAQIPLSPGTYAQNFNGLGAGLPAGWGVYFSAGSNSLGSPQPFASAATSWADTAAGFKNVAAADNAGFTGAESTTVQNGAPDRTLGVRQTGTLGQDPGTAFSFNFSSIGVGISAVSFSAQMLSVQPRATTWSLQYGIGPTPTSWTTLASFSDPGAFGATTVAVNSSIWGGTLNNQANAWFRVVALAPSSGTNSRDTFAIDDFAILVAPPPAITSQPVSSSNTLGGSTSFPIFANGSGVLTYQWRKGGANILNNGTATTPTLTLTNISSSDAGNYTVIVSDANGSITSAVATLTYVPAPAAVTLDSLAQTYNGAPRTATATTSPTGRTVTLTYNGSPTPPTNAGSYALVATINDPDYQGSASGTLTVAKAAATIALGTLNQAYTGAPRSATATTSPGGLSVDFTYGGSSSPPTGIGGYALVATINDTNYQGLASAGFIISPAAQVIAFPAPADHLPDDPPFALSATASSGLPVTLAIVSGSPAIANLSGNVVTLTGNLGAVTLRATQVGGGTFAPAPPVERTFHVVAALAPPSLITQPVGVTVLISETVTLTGAANGSPAPGYQWQKDGLPIPGATSATLTIPNATPADSGLYVLTATNSLGTVSSVPVSVLVNKRAQSISFGPSATSFPAGASVTLNPVSTAGLPVTLSFVSGSGSLAGNLLTGTGDVIIRASQAGNATYAAITVDRTFSFVAGAAAPFLLVSPANQLADAGGTATFRASALGTPAPTYQWQKDGSPIAGAESPTLVLAGLTLADAARYTIVVTNSGGVATASAQLVVRAAPVIVSSPGDQAVLAGEPVQLAVAVTGVPAPAFQWRKNGVNIPGATSALLTIPGARSSDAGRYDVVVTNPLGSATSAIATLAVTTRDLAGDYFGRFPGTIGGFALQVRADGSAIFLGHLPAAQTGFVVRDLTVDLTGRFALTFSTLAGTAIAASSQADAPSPPLAAASQTVTLRGTLDEASGTVTGALPELGVTLEGTRAARSGPAQLHAGFYQAALLGSANDRGYFIVAPDGTLYGLISRAGQLSSVSQPLALSAEGRLVVPSTATNASLDLSFDRGALRGTVGAGTGASALLAGAAGVLSGTEHLVNVSVRSVTSPGAATLITGFVVSGAASKQLLIRVAGPALAAAPFNLPGVLPDPTLQLYRGSLVIAQNDDWNVPAASAAAITAAGTRVGAFAFRPGSADAALLTTLSPGAYTVVVGGGSGTTLAEVYEVLDANEAPGARRLVNLSARGITAPGSPLIAGFVITGTAPQRVLVRGIGPTLGAPPFNLAGALPNPTLTLFRGSTSLKTNDDWFRDADASAIREAAAKAGAFPLGGQSLDAAMLLYLEPGAYTAQVSAGGNGIGVVLVEVYEAAP